MYTFHAEEKFTLPEIKNLGITKKHAQTVVEKPGALDKSEDPVHIAIGDFRKNLSFFTLLRKDDMNAKYYQDDDLLVVKLSNKPFKAAEKIGSFIVHYDANKEAVLVEILNASRLLKATSKALSPSMRESFFSTP